jgi:hypothetical protein
MTQQVISNMAIEKAAECARAAMHWNFYDLVLRFCSRYMDIACVEVDRACPPAHAALLVTQHLQHKHFADTKTYVPVSALFVSVLRAVLTCAGPW